MEDCDIIMCCASANGLVHKPYPQPCKHEPASAGNAEAMHKHAPRMRTTNIADFMMMS